MRLQHFLVTEKDFKVFFFHRLYEKPRRVGKGSPRKAKGATECSVTLLGKTQCSTTDEFDDLEGEKIALERAIAPLDRRMRTRIWKAYRDKRG